LNTGFDAEHPFFELNIAVSTLKGGGFCH